MATCQIRLLVNSDLLVWRCPVSRGPSGRQLPPGVAAEEKNCSNLFCRVWVLPNLEENLPRGGQAGPGPLCPADSFGLASWFRKTQSMPFIQHKSPLLLISHETNRLYSPSILWAEEMSKIIPSKNCRYLTYRATGNSLLPSQPRLELQCS